MRNKSLLSVFVVLALALSAVFVPAASAQDNPLADCDPATQALVWAARDAYGYNFNAASAARVETADDMSGDSMDDMDNSDDESDDGEDMEMTPEATEAAKLVNTAKVPTAIQQDATEEPGDDSMDDMMVTPVDCDAVRADAVAFVYNAVGMTMGGSMDTSAANTFTVDGQTITPNYQVMLSGPQEVPGPGDDDGTGQAWVSIDGDTNTVCWYIQVSGINLPASAAHIHTGAEGESGGVVVPLSAPAMDGVASGCTTAEADVVQAILNNSSGYYVNVHNADFPDGAVRGQLLGL